MTAVLPPSKVLLIEDDPKLEEILAASLLEDQIELHGVADGREALKIVGNNKYDLILLDLGLPGLDGFEVLRLLRANKQSSTIPVIVLTAWHSTHDKVRGFELGASDYITKPFELVELRARVRTTLRNKKLQDELTLTNQQLEAARAAAEEGARTKSEFLANMSHEIRTPMNGVIAMTALLQQTRLTPEQKDFIETIRASGEALLTIIDDILNFSKIEAGRLELEERSFDLRQCVEGALDLLAAKAAEKQIELAYLVSEDLPQQVMGDVTRLRQILVNLISNAVKFTKVGEVVVEVKLSAAEHPDQPNGIDFSVCDTGTGIPEDRLPRLFRSFSQADSSITRQYGGTGLGLAICKGLVDLMHGRLWVESTLGQGSTFHFTLPLPAVGNGSATIPRLRERGLAGRRALLVDDNAASLRIIGAWLQSWGILTELAATGSGALDLLRSCENFDVAIMDLHMPGMDGPKLASEIRRIQKLHSLPLILLSSFGVRVDSPEITAAAFNAVVSKPLKPAQLFDALNSAFSIEPSGQQPSNQKTPQPAVLDSSLATGLPLRILLTDDNLINQKVAIRMLNHLGYHADIAGTGAEALEAAKRNHYDLILMDVQMPHMDGLEATRRLRQWESDTGGRRSVVIAMTANAMIGDREKCLAAGMDEYIPKPVRPEVLQAKVEHFRQQFENSVSARPPRTSGLAEASLPAEIPPGPAPAGSAVDFERLLEFASGSRENLVELIELYTKQTDEQLTQMGLAIQSNAAAELSRLAHSCAGASATCGVISMVPLLRDLERMGRDGQITEAASTYQLVSKEFQRVQHSLHEHLKSSFAS